MKKFKKYVFEVFAEMSDGTIFSLMIAVVLCVMAGCVGFFGG